MGIDIGQALREGASRTAARHGLALAAVFAGIALLTTVLFQTLSVAAVDTVLATLQSASPGDLGLTQTEYEQAVSEAETSLGNIRDASPLALGVSVGPAAAGLVALALVGEAVSIVAVRVFAAESPGAVRRDDLTENILLATLNGFVGGIIVWGLIAFGAVFLLLPGIALAVLFYFMRQEIAINDKNFVQAMADSWRITKGNRIRVFVVGAVLVIVSRLEEVSSAAVGVVSTTGGAIAASVVGGLLAAFGAAVATRAYVQLGAGDEGAERAEPDEEPTDPYDAALGPDDLSR
ncbi:hypothetical protein [Natronomonas sp.]|uniref:hypothetical protein n=1 Tax=Natronomonas sp. TaxID=2184060 RepID=UPI00260832BE|nr:hypothetical protein [Natronomonas sp.]